MEELEASKKQANEDKNYLNSLTASMDEISSLPLSPKRNQKEHQTPIPTDNVRKNLNSAQSNTLTQEALKTSTTLNLTPSLHHH